MGRHANAQAELATAFEQVFGRAPTVNERLFAGAIALGESGYSTARYYNKVTGESKVLNNFGAIQCPSATRPCPAGSFEVSDYEVLEDGSHKPFNQCYCDDATRADAAVRFIKTLYQKRPQLLEAASIVPPDALAQLATLKGVNRVENPAPLYGSQENPDPVVSLSNPYYLHIAWFSHVMRDSKYYGLELRYHIGAQIRYHNAIAAETGERIDGGLGNMPTPKAPPDSDPYSREEWLSLLGQSLLQDAEDKKAKRGGGYAVLPPRAESILRRYQLSHGLKFDGIPGVESLKHLLGIK